MRDAFRLGFGTLTILRVRPPRRVDGTVGRDAMLMAPFAGLVVGLLAELVALIARWAIPGYSDRLLVAVLGISAVALLTRGLHLDGLADTADGLGSGRSGSDAREVMKRSDIGPFGVMTMVLVLLLQVSALYTALLVGRGTLALVGGAVVARLGITWTCRRGVRSAQEDGLGAMVAGSVPVVAAAATTILVTCFLAIVVWLDDDIRWPFMLNVLVALTVALVASQLFVRHCVRRFGGVTGDVLGATNEIAFVAFMLVVALR